MNIDEPEIALFEAQRRVLKIHHLWLTVGNGPAHPPDWMPAGEGHRRWFPRSPCDRSVREVPSSTPAASPRLRRRHSTWPPYRWN